MESEHVKSAANKLTGKVKEAVGDATDNQKLKAEGLADQGKAKVQKAVGDAKDALEK
ncbi:CsbD family protein [Fretibacter rubidus]|uniref:CsbD family protein n=1 Tax=Fretibacter rubidus TaxID=570162 RepID=UPI00352B8389